MIGLAEVFEIEEALRDFVYSDLYFASLRLFQVMSYPTENPGKIIIPALEDAICENMKLNTLEKVKNSLINQEFVVKVPSDVAEKAKHAIDRMLEVS